MQKRPVRGGIERKFFRSILWVGIVPMTLALVIGYVFAREGQWIATQQNQATAARKTAEGIWLAMQGRLMMVRRTALDSEILATLRTGRFDAETLKPLLLRLQRETGGVSGLGISLSLYDKEGGLLLSTSDLGDAQRRHPEWLELVHETRFVNFTPMENEQRYAAWIVAPIVDPQTQERIGFLCESQGVQDLLNFALGSGVHHMAPSASTAGDAVRAEPPEEKRKDRNSYQVVYLGVDSEFAVSAAMSPGGGVGDLKLEEVDPRLRERLKRSPDKDEDTFFLWRYQANETTQPVLMAYHRLHPDVLLYFVVYRSVSDVFANINLGLVIALIVSSVTIGVFWLIGYRIVNNNIIRPVSLLNEGAQIIRQGDLDLKLRIDTGDEIEELAISFNNMAATLRQNIEQIEDSEEKYRGLITSMRDGIYQTDETWVLNFVNPEGARILGFESPEAATGANLRDMFRSEADADRIANELDTHHFVEHTRVWVKSAQGRTICVELSANSVFSEIGLFEGVEGSFRDVTENVQLENEARERSDRISAINEITNAINSSLEAGRVYERIVMEVRRLMGFDFASVALLDPSGDHIEIRQLWPERRHTGPAPQLRAAESSVAWVGRERHCLLVDDLRVTESPFASEFPEEIHSCLCAPLYASGRIIGTLNLGAKRRAGFGEHEVDVLGQLTPHVAVAIRNAELLEHLQESLEEVTQAREKLHQANEELKTLDEMKTNLLSNVSHELRTPLVAVMGYTDMIYSAKVGPINELQQEYLGISLRNIEKLVTLIENLLDFSRLHRGAEEMVFDTIDLVDCARTSMQIVRPVSDSRSIELVLTAPEGKVLVEGDKGKLGQVFNNLLSNAVKFNHNGGRVTVEIRTTDTTAEVSVSDTGIGIPTEALDKVFTRFYQVDSSSTRKYGGTGIGLAIAQDIMRLHGSRITVTSKENEGANFRFSMLLSGIHHRTTDAAGPRLPMPTETHLLVELLTQDRALSGQIRNLLVSEGMDVIHAAYPAVAVTLANRYNPDCLLIDTEAGPLGSVVIEEILSDPSAGRIPIVLLTNDDALYAQYQPDVAGRIRRGFRKSSLLSGIHFALSRGVAAGEQLGDKVLCVDDDTEIVTFISRCLKTEGYEADTCSTGEEAIEKVQTGEYWLVLLDIAMPGIDGWEVCSKIKSNAALSGIKVYVVTAKPVDKSLDKVQASGADGYLLKPFKSDDLLALVQGFENRRPKKDE